MSFSPNGRYLIAGSRSDVRVIDMVAGKQQDGYGAAAIDFDWSPDGEVAVINYSRHDSFLLNVKERRARTVFGEKDYSSMKSYERAPFETMRIVDDVRALVMGHRRASLWHYRSHKKLADRKIDFGYRPKLSPDKTIVMTVDDDSLIFHDLAHFFPEVRQTSTDKTWSDKTGEKSNIAKQKLERAIRLSF